MHFTLGTGFEPEALNLTRELVRLEQKIAEGADYVMTQPLFGTSRWLRWKSTAAVCAFLVGVMILSSLEHAQRVRQIPGVVIPDIILERLGKFDRPADQAKVGQDIAVEQCQWIRRAGWEWRVPHVAGRQRSGSQCAASRIGLRDKARNLFGICFPSIAPADLVNLPLSITVLTNNCLVLQLLKSGVPSRWCWVICNRFTLLDIHRFLLKGG